MMCQKAFVYNQVVKYYLGRNFPITTVLRKNNIFRLKGEDYYSIQGENKIDMNNNGCYSNDIIFPSLNLQVVSTTNNINYFLIQSVIIKLV